jgi:hypothetical protein
MNKLFYEYMNKHHSTYELNHDILGYVDKDVEKNYVYLVEDGSMKSLSNTELDKEGE